MCVCKVEILKDADDLYTRILTPVSMQTTHSELPGPSTGLGADGVTGVPGVCGELGMWKALGSNGGDTGAEDPGTTGGSTSCSTALHAPPAGIETPTINTSIKK